MPDTLCSTTSYLSDNGMLDAHLFQSSGDCIKIIDLDGRLLQLNPGGVTALEMDDPGAMAGLHWPSQWPGESQAEVQRALATAIEGKPAQFAGYCPTAKGGHRWWDVMVSPIHDDGKIVRIMAVSRDVTELYLAREALKAADRRKDEFLMLLAHELRNPLSAAGMAATVLQSQNLDPDRIVHLGKLVARQVGHMSRLVEDLIDISRVSRGLISLRMEPVRLREVAGEAAEQLQESIRAKRHTLAMSFCEPEPLVSGDRTRLVQVIANLIGNAARYTPEGGMIRVEVRREAGSATLAVSDTGIGIAADKMAGLFHLYAQVESTSERSGGLGLGLALVRGIMDLHAGTVTAESPGEGGGSTFTLTFPALD